MGADSTVILAPAAGSGIGKMLADEILSRPGIVQRMADVLENALQAERRTWDQGQKKWVTEPDTRSQLQALFGMLAHMEGEPIKRVLHQHMGNKGEIDLHGALQDSPALRDALQRELDKAGWRDAPGKGRKVRRADPIEVE